MTKDALKMQSDDPVFRQGLRERLRMRSLQIGSRRGSLSAPQEEVAPTGVSEHDWKAESQLRRQFENFLRSGFGPASAYDSDGRLTAKRDEVQRLLDGGDVDGARSGLSQLEDLAGAILSLAAKRQEQESRLPADANSLHRGAKIASGSFGAVFHAESDTGAPLVVKTGIGDAGRKDLQTEVDVYAQLGESENIMKCYGMHTVDGQTCMVMEAIDGGGLDKAFRDLNNLRNSGQMSHEEYWGATQHLFRGLFKGLKHMEEAGFVHNDLKGDNVMFDARTGEAKLVDVGMASRVGDASRMGHEFFAAPEKWNAMSQGEKVDTVVSTASQDVYSAGQMLFNQGEREATRQEDGKTEFGKEEYFGFDGKATGPNRMMIAAQMYGAIPDFLTQNDQGEFVARALTGAKPGADAAEAGKFAEGYESDYVSFLNAIMHPDPTQRLTAAAALEHPFLKDSMLDEEGARAALAKMVESRNPPPVDPAEAQKQADEVRHRVGEVLGEAKTLRKLISTAEKQDEKALKQVESASQLLITTRKGKRAISEKRLKRLNERLATLNELEGKLTAGAERVSDVTHALGELLPAAGKKDDSGNRRSDESNQEKLASLARSLTLTHAQVTHSIAALKSLLETVAAEGNKGKGEKIDAESPKEVRRDAEQVRASMDDLLEKLEQDSLASRQSHALTEQLLGRANKALAQSAADGAIPADDLDRDLRKQSEKCADALRRVTEKWDSTAGMISRFEELAGASTKKEKGRKKEKAVALSASDQNLLIALSALSRRIEWLKASYTSDIESLDAKGRELGDEVNRRIFDLSRTLNGMKIEKANYRQLDQLLYELETMQKSKFAGRRAVRQVLSVTGRVRLQMKAAYDQQQSGVSETRDHANLLLEFGAARPPSSKGNSDSFFIYSPTGEPEYILKPTNGESRFSDAWPEGGGAPREILMSRMGGFLNEITGIEFGIPETELVSLDDPSFASGTKSQDTKRVGALQKALTIQSGDPPDAKKMLEADESMPPDLVDRILQSINPKDAESIAIFDFLMLNGDRHAENLMVQNPGQNPGETHLVPIDSGQCLPTPEAFRRGAASMTSTTVFDLNDNPYIDTEGQNLLMQLPGALNKMSPEAQASLQKLDPDAIVAKMKAEYDAMAKAAPEMAGKVDDASFEMVGRSAAFLKKACSELTLREISQVYASGFIPIVDAAPDQVDGLIDQAIADMKRYIAMGGDDELLRNGVPVGNPPLSLSERTELLAKIKAGGVDPGIEQYKVLCGQLGDMDRFLIDSSDEDKRKGAELYALRDSLDKVDFKLANIINDFCAYKAVGGDPMLKAMLAGNDKAYREYAKSTSVTNKCKPMYLNPIKEFFRLGGYDRLKELLGDEYSNVEDLPASEHTDLLYELTQNPPSKGSGVKSGGAAPVSRSEPSVVPDPIDPDLGDLETDVFDEEETERLAVGGVTSANPTLWFDNKQFGDRYRVSTAKPRIEGDWHALNQFCSLLALCWLENPGAALRFGDLSERRQLADAEVLIGFGGLEDQVRFASQRLGGKRTTSISAEELRLLDPGSRVWFGNDRHVMAALILPGGRARFYDPDTGRARDMSRDDLLKQLSRGNVFVVAGESAPIEVEPLPDSDEQDEAFADLLNAKSRPADFLSELLKASETSPAAISKSQHESIRDAYLACEKAVEAKDRSALQQEIYTLNDAISETASLAAHIREALLVPMQAALSGLS